MQRNLGNAPAESNGSRTNLQLCMKYKRLIKELESSKDELCDPDNNQLIDKLNDALLMSAKAEGAVETLLYSKFVDLAATITEKKVKNISTTQIRFDPTIYHTNLIKEIKNEIEDDTDNEVFAFWSTMAKFTRKLWRDQTPSDLSLPFSEYSFDENIKVLPSKKRQATSSSRDILPVKELHPEVKTLENEEETDQVQKILDVITALHRSDPSPIDYFELVTNPKSFSKTIENMFHLSFLAKNGKVRIIHDANMLMAVELCTNSSSTSTRPIVNQAPISLNKAKWREICKVFELENTDPLIPA